jgi:DNA polymerase I-like protein with 3'-5' exonuclease and polymerase domains
MIYLVTNRLDLYNSTLYTQVDVVKAIKLLKEEKELGLDTETTGLDCHTKKLLLLQIGTSEYQILFDISSFHGKIPLKLKKFLNEYTGTFILQNAKFDLKFLLVQDVILKYVYDTMLVETIITNGMQYGGRDLATLADKYCGVTLDKSIRGDIITKGLNDAVLQYGAKDVEYLSTIKRKQLVEVGAFNLQRAVDLDNQFVIVLAYIEFCGIKLDYSKWKKRTDKNVEKSLELRTNLEEQLWKDQKFKYFSGMKDMWTGKQNCILNWDSPKQILALFQDYGINTEIRVKGKINQSIEAKVLEPQAENYTIIKPYLDYKAASKEISTYGYNWKKFINAKTGRIHTTFKQLMDTGRLSSGNKRDGSPNLQNIPSDPETRSCFIAEPGNLIASVDYSGQEQIILANFSQEENLINFYKKGFSDMHSYVAFLMYSDIRHCTIEELTPDKLSYIKKDYLEKRKIAKNAGFAINYGGNGSTIAKNCNITKSEGNFVYDSYFKSFPGLKTYFNTVLQRALQTGYIQFNSITKRKYLFSPENGYFKYKDDVEDKYFWQMSENPRSIMGKYNKAQNEIARLAQNYPIQG